MDPRTKNRLALAVAIACGVAAFAWRQTHRDDAGQWRSAPGDGAAAPVATTESSRHASPTTSASAAAGPHLDRKQADEMRERIHALLADAGLAWGSVDGPDAAPTEPGASAGLYPEMPSAELRDDAGMTETAKYIQRRVREELFPLARQCYGAQLEKNPKLAGRFVMHFRIVGDRRVGGVVDTAYADDAGTLTDPEFSKCMTESMMSVTFDAPPGKSGQVTVTYPIEFSPDDDDAGADGAP